MLTKKLRIGIDGSIFTEQPRGHSLYTYRLCQHLGQTLPNAQFFVYSPWSVDLTGFQGNWNLRTGKKKSCLSPILWLKSIAGGMCQRDGLDVFWSPYVFLPRLNVETKTLITVYDFINRLTPDSFSGLHTLAHSLFAKSDIRRADSIITISQGTDDKLFRYHGRRSLVIKPAAEEQFQRPDEATIQATRQAFNISSPYLLNVAAWDPRKNQTALIHAFLRLKRDGAIPHRLVLVGKAERASSDVQRLIDEHPDIQVLGYVDEKHLPALYAGADVFVFPSIYEGFGMPVQEARCCGTPVVTTDIPELREAGDEHCIYVNPTPAGIQAGILTALTTLPERPRFIRHQSWNTQAELLANEFVRVVESASTFPEQRKTAPAYA